MNGRGVADAWRSSSRLRQLLLEARKPTTAGSNKAGTIGMRAQSHSRYIDWLEIGYNIRMTLPADSAREGADLAFLTSAGAAEVLRAALGPGVVLRSWGVHSQHHRPGAGVSVGYGVVVDEPQPDGSIVRREKYLCASTAHTVPSAGVRTIATNGTDIRVWEFPEDPELPILRVACSPAHMSDLLGTPVSIELLGYRPTRRAVVKISSEIGVMAFGKVVRPTQVAALAQRYRMLTQAGVPAPLLLFDHPEGLLVTEAISGIPLANVISRGLGTQVRSMFRALERVLDALPADITRFRRRPAWSERAEHYAHAAATVLPSESTRCFAVAREVFELMAVSHPGPIVPVHGDFYEANVFVDRKLPKVTGIIDVDSMGPGHRVDDLACLLGHLSVLPHLAPDSYPKVSAELPVWLEMAERSVDPVALNARCAGVVLSLIAGAKRVDGSEWERDARGRLETSEMWLARARSWRDSQSYREARG